MELVKSERSNRKDFTIVANTSAMHACHTPCVIVRGEAAPCVVVVVCVEVVVCGVVVILCDEFVLDGVVMIVCVEVVLCGVVVE